VFLRLVLRSLFDDRHDEDFVTLLYSHHREILCHVVQLLCGKDDKQLTYVDICGHVYIVGGIKRSTDDCVLCPGMRADVNVVLPIRQTASIFKQPVTIVSNHPDSKTRSDLRHGSQEQPRQVRSDDVVLVIFMLIFSVHCNQTTKVCLMPVQSPI